MAPATTYTFSTIRNNPNLLKRCDGSNTTVPLTNSFADPDAVRDLIARKMLDGTPFVLRQTGKRKVLKYHVFTGDDLASSSSAQAPAPIQPFSGSVVRQVSPVRAPAAVGLKVGQSIQSQDCSNTAVVDRSGTGRGQKRRLLCFSGSIEGNPALVAIALCGPTWDWMKDSIARDTSYRLKRSATGFELAWTNRVGLYANSMLPELRWHADKSRYIEVVTLNNIQLWISSTERSAPLVLRDNRAQYNFVTNVISLSFKVRETGPWRIEVQLKQLEMARIYRWFASTGGLNNQRFKTTFDASNKVVKLKIEAPSRENLEVVGFGWHSGTYRYIST